MSAATRLQSAKKLRTNLLRTKILPAWLRDLTNASGRSRSEARFPNSYVGDLVRFLGDDPRAYTARGLRDFVAQRCRHYRRNSWRMVLAAVRMFLRHLAAEGQCRPGQKVDG